MTELGVVYTSSSIFVAIALTYFFYHFVILFDIYISMKKKIYTLIDTITFWASTSTLICCVLPAIVVSIAGGATMISIISIFPFIVTLSQYKDLLFIISGMMIGLSYLGIRKRKIECINVTDSRKWWKVSLGIWLFGVGFAYFGVYLIV